VGGRGTGTKKPTIYSLIIKTNRERGGIKSSSEQASESKRRVVIWQFRLLYIPDGGAKKGGKKKPIRR